MKRVFDSHSWWAWFKMRVLRIQPFDCNMQAIIDYLQANGHKAAVADLIGLQQQYKAFRSGRG